MRIEKLRLKNFCQHKELDWTIPSGIVAISGPNGSGKSNAIKAIYAALTGDFKRNEGVILDNINKTCSEKDESFIELTFSNSGDVSTILRSLRPSKRSLVVNGGKPITSEKEVTSTIEGLIGISTDILSDYIFVDQWKMFEVFTSSKSDRLSSLQSLYGLGKAETCYDEISKSISKINVPVYSESVNDIDILIKEKTLLVNSLKEKLIELSKLATEDKSLEKELAVVKKIIANNEAIKGYTAEILKSEESIANAEKELSANSLEGLLGDLESYEQLCEKVDQASKGLACRKEFDASLNRIKNIQANIANIDSQIKDLGPAPTKPSNYIAARGQEFEQYNDIVGGHEAKKNCLADLIANNKCPVCLSTGNNLKTAIDLMQKSIESEAVKVVELRKSFADSRDYDSNNVKFSAEFARLKSLKTNLDNMLEFEIEKAIPEPEHTTEKYSEDFKKYTGIKSKYDSVFNSINDLNNKKTYLLGCLNTLKDNKLKLEADNASTGVTASHEELLTLKDNLSAYIETIKVNKENLIRVEESIKATNETISMLETRKSRITKGLLEAKLNMDVKNHLETLREVMHKSNLPKRVAFNYLKQTVVKMNGYLEDFNAPFRVYSDDELMFWVRFNDGRNLPAARLSGGEKVVLALAFRLTVQFGVASGVNLLVLDEPTVGLDDDNIECLEMAFSRLRAMSKSSGLQVLIVSHEKAIERMCDHTISLYR